MSNTHAVVVLGHGSRSAEATEQFLHVVETMRAQLGETPVSAAFMELAEPSLPAAIAQLVASGATDIAVLPCFLFMGNHMKQDIPEILAEIQPSHPGVRLHFVSTPIGPDPRIAQILIERLEECPCLA